jgi:hypothetical protein
MRTTLILDDELYREVKSTAAAAGGTVTSFVEEALREALARHRAVAAGAFDLALPPSVGEGGLLPGVDLTDSSALADLMDAR